MRLFAILRLGISVMVDGMAQKNINQQILTPLNFAQILLFVWLKEKSVFVRNEILF
jgi:hypothetical protein